VGHDAVILGSTDSGRTWTKPVRVNEDPKKAPEALHWLGILAHQGGDPRAAVGLIGRTVNYIDADGVTQTGKVERVATSKDGQASLTIAGKAGIDPSSISEVSA